MVRVKDFCVRPISEKVFVEDGPIKPMGVDANPSPEDVVVTGDNMAKGTIMFPDKHCVRHGRPINESHLDFLDGLEWNGEEPPVGGCEPMDATLDECQ